MADKTTSWHGGKDGLWTEADNWTNGQPSTIGDNDTVIFKKDAIRPPTSDLDRTADAGDGPSLVYISEDVPYPIGAANNPLRMKAIKLIHRGKGTLYYHSLGTSDVIINSPNTAFAANIDGTFFTAVSWLTVSQGHVVCSNELGVTNLTMTALPGKPMPTVLVSEGIIALFNVVVNGGRLDCRALVNARATVSGGYALFTNTATLSRLTVTGGTAVYDVTDGGGAITTLNAIGGQTHLVTKRANPLAITNYCKFPGAEVFKDEGNDIVVIENEYVFE